MRILRRLVAKCLKFFQNTNQPLWLYQLLPFAAHTVLTEESSPLGYRLLCCLRSFLVMDSYAAMEVHTEDTIEDGRKEMLRFSRLISVR